MSLKKSNLERFSVTIEQELLAEFDDLIGKKGYTTRSEAVRNLVREALITQECANPCADAAGAVVIVYNHHERQVAVRLTDRQHRTFHAIVASLHVHIDHDNYMEIIALRGKAAEIRKVDDSLISLKGVRHGRFIKTLANHFP